MRSSSPASPASAFAWELGRRHRWGFAALGAYVVALAAVKLWVAARGAPIVYDSAEHFAFTVTVPMTCAFVYLIAVFTYGLAGDVAARRSTYPARALTLPIPTPALAGWPMLHGAVAVSALWAATRSLVSWPAGYDIPVVWPAFLAVALLAWTQALMWMPYGLRGVRVVVAVLWLATIDTIVLLALHFRAHDAVLIAILAPQLPIAYLVAWLAVARARRGVEPDWRGAFARSGVPGRSRRGAPFPSPAAAQAWYEWRLQGRSLPALVAMVLPFELALLFAARDADTLVLEIVAGTLVTPPVMAAFVGARERVGDPAARDSGGLGTFAATRPLTSAALIASKLRTMATSALVAWLVVATATPVGLALSHTWPALLHRWHLTVDVMGTARAATLAAAIVAACVVWTWRQLVQSLYIGLTGRDWLVKASVFGTLVALSVLAPAVDWLGRHPHVEGVLWSALPLVLWALVALKMCLAGWVEVRLWRSGLIADRVLVAGAACWCASVLALTFLLRWFVATDYFPGYLLSLLAMLAVPLTRLSAAPLALAWNRHR